MSASAPNEVLKLERLQRDILAPQIEAFLAAATDSDARAPYLALRDALARLEVPAGLTPGLEAMAEVLLTSGRVRTLYGPGAELALWALFQKTPRGREIKASLEAANKALQRLSGQPLEHVAAIARAPGSYALTIRTAELQLVVRFEPAGVRLESVEVGG